MATELDTLTAYIARQCLLTPGTFDAITSGGINYKDWPEGIAKKALTNFKEDLEKGFTYAVWKANKAGTIDLLEEVYGAITYPSDAQIIVTEYQGLLWKERAENLGVNICNNPSRTQELISEFLQVQASGVEIVEFGEGIETLIERHRLLKEQGKQKIVLTNWPKLSENIGGFNPGRLGMLVADTGFGKTNLGVQFALDASYDLPTLYFNMEMISEDFTQRLVASMEKLEPRDFLHDWDGGRAILHSRTRKLFYSTGKGLSLSEMCSTARHFKRKQNIEFIVVDYDQKIKLNQSKLEEWRELQKAAEGLEELAKELRCYVLLLAQSNLDGGISGSKRSSFPASQVFMFEKNKEAEADETLIRAAKNRFGPRNASVSVDYKASIASVREKDSFVWIGQKSQSKAYKKPKEKTSEQE